METNKLQTTIELAASKGDVDTVIELLPSLEQFVSACGGDINEGLAIAAIVMSDYEPSQFIPYLLTTLKNTRIDKLRKLIREREILSEYRMELEGKQFALAEAQRARNRILALYLLIRRRNKRKLAQLGRITKAQKLAEHSLNLVLRGFDWEEAILVALSVSSRRIHGSSIRYWASKALAEMRVACEVEA